MMQLMRMMIATLLSFYLISVGNALASDVFACIPRTPNQSSKEAVEHLEQSQGTKLTEKDLLTRLVFAETLSTNYFLDPQCDGQGASIAKAIAWGVMNRVRMGNPNWNSVRKAAFAPNQFAPAISSKSIFSDLFTCPNLLQQDETRMNERIKEQKNRFENHAKKINREIFYSKYIPMTFKFAKAATEEAFHGGIDKNPFVKSGVPSPVLNFYYPLSDDVKDLNPDWNRCNQPLDKVDIDGTRLNPHCARFFHQMQLQRTRCLASVDDDDAPAEPVKAVKTKAKKKVDKKKTN